MEGHQGLERQMCGCCRGTGGRWPEMGAGAQEMLRWAGATCTQIWAGV